MSVLCSHVCRFLCWRPRQDPDYCPKSWLQTVHPEGPSNLSDSQKSQQYVVCVCVCLSVHLCLQAQEVGTSLEHPEMLSYREFTGGRVIQCVLIPAEQQQRWRQHFHEVLNIPMSLHWMRWNLLGNGPLGQKWQNLLVGRKLWTQLKNGKAGASSKILPEMVKVRCKFS